MDITHINMRSVPFHLWQTNEPERSLECYIVLQYEKPQTGVHVLYSLQYSETYERLYYGLRVAVAIVYIAGMAKTTFHFRVVYGF